MKFRLQVEVIGDNGIAWCKHSGIIQGDEAKATQQEINRFSDLKQFSFPKPNGEMVFLNEHMLRRTIITVEDID